MQLITLSLNHRLQCWQDGSKQHRQRFTKVAHLIPLREDEKKHKHLHVFHIPDMNSIILHVQPCNYKTISQSLFAHA
jgi:hypothetical protein